MLCEKQSQHSIFFMKEDLAVIQIGLVVKSYTKIRKIYLDIKCLKINIQIYSTLSSKSGI